MSIDKGILLGVMANLRSAARLSVCAAILATLATVLATPLAAQDEERVAVVELEQLRDAAGAETVPIRVTVESRRAVEADLEVVATARNMSWSFPLALAANTEIQQIVMVPTDLSTIGRIEATLLSGGDELATAQIGNGARNANVNAVGLLGIESPGDEVALNPDIGLASLIELNDLRLLPALDSLVASPASIRALAPEEQNALVSWVWSGKQLMISAESGSLDDFLPEAASGDRDHELVGAGIVRYVGRDWDDHVYPGITVAADPISEFGGFQGQNMELFSDGGFDVPSLRVLTIVLLVYLLVAGPVCFGVLTARKRQSLVWVVLPALAVLFTVGVFVGGKIVNGGRSDAYAAVVEVTPVGSMRTETMLVSRSGRTSVELPVGFSVVGTGSNNNFEEFGPVGQQGGSAPVTQRPSRTTTELVFRIDAGSGATIITRGAEPSNASELVIDGLSIDETTLSGTVQNASGETLEGSVVLVANQVEALGDLGAGETSEFSINLAGGRGRAGGELDTWDVDPRDQFGFNGFEATDAMESGPVNGSTWMDWRAARFGAAVPEGLVTVVGWSREFEGLRTSNGRTALVARASLPDVDAPVLPSQVRTFRMAAPSFNGFNDFGFEGGGGLTDVAHFVRAPGADTSQLALDFSQGTTELAVWVEDNWRWLDVDDQTGTSLAIPDEAWIDDTLTVRAVAQNFNGNVDFVTLLAVTDRTEEVELAPPGEKRERQNRFEEQFFEEGPFGGESFEQKVEEIATGLALDDPDEQSIELQRDGVVEGGYDVWEVELAAGDDVEVQMNGFGGSLDPFLIIRDVQGNQIAEDDDGGGNLNSRLSFTADEDGVFQIETRPLGGGQFGEYEVVITITRPSGGAG